MSTIFFILAILFFILWTVAKSKVIKQEKVFKAEIASLNMEIEKHLAKINDLSRFQHLLDTEMAAKEMIEEAQKQAEALLLEATTELTNAKTEAKNIRGKAIADAQAKIDKAEQFLANATAEYKRIVEEARKKAEDIGGDAYRALENANDIEKSIKAMKNIIEGYGDQYLKPTFSLLDDLAEEFSFSDAGAKLKFAREKTLVMVNQKTAAKCDYVEANRKETAINFVLDAFNGKVDSILSNVKKDNYGTLEQKIRDAFQIVNFNGKAFRNAEITTEYLNARLDELNWAVITQELKWQDQEEQRRIKEQIREEEKARREFEKAMKDAQKEEESLKKLIEKAQSQIQQASDEQKAKFEEKLKELEVKLQEAEAKNQRAMSMAQQTKSGHVYIISNIGSFGENVYKIGMTRRLEPLDRIKELGDASVPFDFDVHSMIYCDDAPKLENDLHRVFMLMQMNKVNPRKEFFKLQLANIKAEVDRLGIETHWTLTAEARQYRESLAVEETIANDPEKRKEWERFQMQVEVEEMAEEVEIS